MKSLGDLSSSSTLCEAKDFLPVSKFSKYHSHFVCSNEHFIVYTPSKRGIVRVLRQEDGSHLALNTNFTSNISSLHLWESPNSSSLLAIGAEDGKISIWEIMYPAMRSDPSDEGLILRQTMALPPVPNFDHKTVCKSIAGTRHFACAVGDSIYFSTVPGDEGSRGCVIKFDDLIVDFDLHPNGQDLTLFTASGALWSCTYDLDKLFDRKFLHYYDLPTQRSTAFPDVTNVWYLAGEGSEKAQFVLIRQGVSKRISIVDRSLDIVHELDVSGSVVADASFMKYNSSSNVVMIGSFTSKFMAYFISLDFGNGSPTFSAVAKVVFPEEIQPLEFSLSTNFERENVVDLYIFHTKGLSILPVTILHASQEDESAANDLTVAIQKRLADFKVSPSFPKKISSEAFDNFETLLIQSGVLDVISDRITAIVSSKFENRIQELERSLGSGATVESVETPSIPVDKKERPVFEDVNSSSMSLNVSSDVLQHSAPRHTEDLSTDFQSLSSSAASPHKFETQSRGMQDLFDKSHAETMSNTSGAHTNESFEHIDSFAVNPPQSQAPPQPKPVVEEPPRELTSQEYLLLSAIGNHDLSGAVRIATTNVTNVSLTRVLDTYLAGTGKAPFVDADSSRESALVDALLTGDALVLLSFIAVLSSDISKKEGSGGDGPQNLASCLNWLQKLIVLINDNFARYATYASLIAQVYGRTQGILKALPPNEMSPAAASLIQELDRKS